MFSRRSSTASTGTSYRNTHRRNAFEGLTGENPPSRVAPRRSHSQRSHVTSRWSSDSSDDDTVMPDDSITRVGERMREEERQAYRRGSRRGNSSYVSDSHGSRSGRSRAPSRSRNYPPSSFSRYEWQPDPFPHVDSVTGVYRAGFFDDDDDDGSTRITTSTYLDDEYDLRSESSYRSRSHQPPRSPIWDPSQLPGLRGLPPAPWTQPGWPHSVSSDAGTERSYRSRGTSHRHSDIPRSRSHRSESRSRVSADRPGSSHHSSHHGSHISSHHSSRHHGSRYDDSARYSPEPEFEERDRPLLPRKKKRSITQGSGRKDIPKWLLWIAGAI